MRGKLIKTEFGFKLNNLNGIYIASVAMNSLSLKNCEAIENGYDLDELAESEYGTVFESVRGSKEYDIEADRKNGFKTGFQKALSILGDKKFSEDDVRRAYNDGSCNIDCEENPVYDIEQDVRGTIQSLQQTEWEVRIDVLMTEREKGVVIETPKLDENGCLILRRL